jgi:hypothetical protein
MKIPIHLAIAAAILTAVVLVLHVMKRSCEEKGGVFIVRITECVNPQFVIR